MLVLTRKPEEHILIGEEIRISVVSVKGNKVRIGITAPNAVRIRREELPSDSRNEFAEQDDAPAANICAASTF